MEIKKYCAVSEDYAQKYAALCNAPAEWVLSVLDAQDDAQDAPHIGGDSYTVNAARIAEARATSTFERHAKFLDNSGKIVNKRIFDKPRRAGKIGPARLTAAPTIDISNVYGGYKYIGAKKPIASPIIHRLHGMLPHSMDALKNQRRATCAEKDNTIAIYTNDMSAARYIIFVPTVPDFSPVFYRNNGKNWVLWEAKYQLSAAQPNAGFEKVPYIVKNDGKKPRIKGKNTYTQPTYNSSDDAKNSVETRLFTDVERLALRCAIGAVKNAIAPRGKNIGDAQKITYNRDKIPTCYYDERLERCITEKIELPAGKGDNTGTYTMTMRQMLHSLQRFAHSNAQSVPDDYNAQDLYSTAVLHIYSRARIIGVSPLEYVSGYLDFGAPITRVITNGPRTGSILYGPRAVYAACSAACSAYIRGEKKNVDRKFSVDHISQGNDEKAPEKYDIPDMRSISKMQAAELAQNINTTLKNAFKNEKKRSNAAKVCNMLLRGENQQHIAEILGTSQSYVAKLVSDIRAALLTVPEIANSCAARGYNAYTTSMQLQLEDAKKSGMSADEIRKATKQRQKIARKIVQKEML